MSTSVHGGKTVELLDKFDHCKLASKPLHDEGSRSPASMPYIRDVKF